jgi:hypothetical protein
MTVPLSYNTPETALRGVRLVTFILLLVSAAVWLGVAGIFVVGGVAVFVFFHAGAGPAGGSFPLWAYGVLFLEFLVPVGFTGAYAWTAVAIRRASRAGAITAIVVTVLNMVVPILMMIGVGDEMARRSNVDPGVVILLVLALLALVYLATLLVFLVRTLRAGRVNRVAGFVPSLANAPISRGDS